MQDISIRLRNALAGITAHSLEEIPGGCVLATRHLLPSDTVFLAGRSVSAVLLEYGSAGSHATLFAQEMGLPMDAREKVESAYSRYEVAQGENISEKIKRERETA